AEPHPLLHSRTAVNTGLTHLLPPQEAACGPLRQLLLHSLCYRLCRPALARAAQLPSCCPLRPPELATDPPLCSTCLATAAGTAALKMERPVTGGLRQRRSGCRSAAASPSLSGAAARTEDPDGRRLDVSKAATMTKGSMSQLFSSPSHRRRTKSSSTSGTSGENRACGCECGGPPQVQCHISPGTPTWIASRQQQHRRVSPPSPRVSGCKASLSSSSPGSTKTCAPTGAIADPAVVRGPDFNPVCGRRDAARLRIAPGEIGLLTDFLQRPAAGQCGGWRLGGWLQAEAGE
uniref:Family with sequence similarity 177 member A1 n=1 Tax=Macrostomum lignano TaxID=282301 RepID=A0A1I8FFQ8_9PLAT